MPTNGAFQGLHLQNVLVSTNHAFITSHADSSTPFFCSAFTGNVGTCTTENSGGPSPAAWTSYRWQVAGRGCHLSLACCSRMLSFVIWTEGFVLVMYHLGRTLSHLHYSSYNQLRWKTALLLCFFWLDIDHHAYSSLLLPRDIVATSRKLHISAMLLSERQSQRGHRVQYGYRGR